MRTYTLKNLGKIQLKRLREDIVLNSLFVADYRNRYGIDEKEVCDFFDSFLSYYDSIEQEKNNGQQIPCELLMEMHDNIEDLVEYHSQAYWY